MTDRNDKIGSERAEGAAESASVRAPADARAGGKGLLAPLYSVELTLWLLGLLVVAMILGTIIPQKAAAEQYIKFFGTVFGGLLVKSALVNVFDSWQFQGLFVLLAVNLAACVIHRGLALARRQGAAPRPLSSAQVRAQRNASSWSASLDPAAAADRLQQALIRQGYRVIPIAGAAKEETAFRGRRGGLRPWGPVVVHVGLVVVVLGYAVGRIPAIAFHRDAPINQGDAYTVAMGADSYDIRLLDAGTEKTREGAPTKYWAKTQVIENDKVAREFTISSNRPLRENGTNVVLLSMSEAPSFAVEASKGESVEYVPVVGAGHEDMGGTLTVLKDPPWLVFTTRFDPEWYPGKDEHAKHGPEPPRPEPAAKVWVNVAGRPTPANALVGWVTEAGTTYKGVRFRLVMAGGSKNVVLGVHKDPGVPVVWGGFALIILGCMFAFFVNRREVTAVLSPKSGGQTRIVLGASAQGFGPGAQQTVDALGADLGARQEVEGK